MPDNNSQEDDPSREADSAASDGGDPAPAAADDDGAASPQAQNPDPNPQEQGSGARGPVEEALATEEGRDDPPPPPPPLPPGEIALARFLREIYRWTRDRNIISYFSEVLAAGNFDGDPEFVVENNVLLFAGIPIAELERPHYGLSPEVIRRIPGRTYEVPTCSICHDIFHEDDYIRKLPCRHEFHSNCLVDVLSCSSSSTCPQCEKEILK